METAQRKSLEKDNRIQVLTDENDRLQARVRQLEKDASVVWQRKVRVELETKLEAAETKCNEKNQWITELRNAKDTLNRRVSQLEQDNSEKQQEIGDYMQRVTNLEAERNELRRAISVYETHPHEEELPMVGRMPQQAATSANPPSKKPKA